MKHGFFDNMEDKRRDAWETYGHTWQDECDDDSIDTLVYDMAQGW